MAVQTLQLAAESLVLRARQGDQNAMGMIAQVREQASRGVQKCKESLAAIAAYIKANPLKEDSYNFGGEGTPRVTYGSIVIANGPMLTDEYIMKLGAQFGTDEEEDTFLASVGAFRNLVP